MSKISKAIAERVALQVTANLKQRIDDTEKEMQVAVTELLKKRVPDAVMEVFKKHPEYIENALSVSLNSNGYRYRRVTLTEKVPIFNGSGYIENITNKEVAPLDKIEQKKDKLQEKYNRVKTEIENTLLGLGTYNRVKEQLPKLYPLLPTKSGSMGLMLVPEQVRNTVDCLLSEEKNCIEKL